jgi:hypothetical protein
MTVVFIEDAANPASWDFFEGENPAKIIMDRFPVLPESTRIYIGAVSDDCDITPRDPNGVERLSNARGDIYVVTYPQDPLTAIAVVVGVVISVAASFLLRPPIPTLRNAQAESPNNSLGNRQNSARLLGRIPDIFGTDRSIPDLISQPYRVFEGNVEIEYQDLCIGRGFYDISDIREGTTALSSIAGSSIEIFEPGSNGNDAGATPQITIGTSIAREIYDTKNVGSVNGQVMCAPNGESVLQGNNNVFFNASDEIVIAPSDFDDFGSDFKGTTLAENFTAGQDIVVNNASFISDFDSSVVNLNGTYEIASVGTSAILLVDPASVNADWNKLDDLSPTASPGLSARLSSSGDCWIGPFIVDTSDRIASTFLAQQGLFKDDGNNQFPATVEIDLELTPIDATDTPNGAIVNETIILRGSSTSRDRVGVTNLFSSGQRYSVRAQRVTPLDLAFEGSVVDEVKWVGLLGQTRWVGTDFGNVTTIRAKTAVTPAATSIQERSLNMLVTRKIPTRIGETDTFSAGLTATNRADEIIAAVCLDPYIGARVVDELDLDLIYGEIARVEAYYGTSEAVEFNYTFDNDNLSLEEALGVITSAVSCQEYRQAQKIRITADLATEDSAMIFNHRNKIPMSEKRSDRFGLADDVDGVELQWMNPETDAIDTLYIPEDKTAFKPRKIETVGIRNRQQAWTQAWRIWQRTLYENSQAEFTATQEAELLPRTTRILNADNTRSIVQDGDIEAQDGLNLTLSQPVMLNGDETYAIHIQHTDGTVEAKGISSGATENEVILAGALKQAISVDPNNYARATYLIEGSDSDNGFSPYQIREVNPQNDMTAMVKAVLYSPLYYIMDGTGIWVRDGLIDYGPDQIAVTAVNGAAQAVDATRGNVLDLTETAYVTSPYAAVADDPYSFTAWINLESLTASTLLQFATGYDLTLSAGGVLSINHDAGVVGASTAINVATWTHVSVVYDGADASIYIDGALDASGAIADAAAIISLQIGGDAFDGFVSDVRLYRRALSPQDVKALYLNTIL